MPNYHLLYRGFTLLKLTLFYVLLFNAECAQNKDEAKVTLKVLRPYKANLTYVIQDYFSSSKLEDKTDNIKSSLLSTESEPDIKWYFQISPTISNVYQNFGIKLNIRSLPSNVARVSGLVECGLVDVKGKKQYIGKSSKSNGPGGYFGKYDLQQSYQGYNHEKNFIKEKELTIYCDVSGFLYNHEIANNREVIQSVNSTLCATEISTDTIEKLNLFTDKQGHIELESSWKRFHCQRNIFEDRLPVFNLTATITHENQTIVYDLSEYVNAEELEDLVNFMYRGNATNLKRTCRVLSGVASKFGFECLRITCEEVLIGQVKGVNAKEYLELAEIVQSERLKETAVHCMTKPTDEKCLV